MWDSYISQLEEQLPDHQVQSHTVDIVDKNKLMEWRGSSGPYRLNNPGGLESWESCEVGQ